ncbi:MAG TPA: VCBS repeat-containing protein [Candidatus Eisenbacteria bacterium]
MLLGNGNGTFGPKTDYPTANEPVSVAIADLDVDGNLDLAVADDGYPGNSAVSVLLGDGMAGLGAKTDYATGMRPQSVAIGDLNGDGKPDRVTGNYIAHSVSVLIGNGDSSFGTHDELVVGFNPKSVAIADVNGDGNADLVTPKGKARLGCRKRGRHGLRAAAVSSHCGCRGTRASRRWHFAVSEPSESFGWRCHDRLRASFARHGWLARVRHRGTARANPGR